MEKLPSFRTLKASITLIFLVLVLFMEFNYIRLGAQSHEGGVTKSIITDMMSMDQYLTEQSTVILCNQSFNMAMQHTSVLFDHVVVVSLLLAFTARLYYLTKGSLSLKEEDTLVSLCVRMNR